MITLHELTVLLSFISIAMKSHHGQGNSYKSNHLIGAVLQFQRYSHFYHSRKKGRHEGRHDAGEEAKCSASLFNGSKEETVFYGLKRRVSSALEIISKPTPTVMHFLQQEQITS